MKETYVNGKLKIFYNDRLYDSASEALEDYIREFEKERQVNAFVESRSRRSSHLQDPDLHRNGVSTTASMGDVTKFMFEGITSDGAHLDALSQDHNLLGDRLSPTGLMKNQWTCQQGRPPPSWVEDFVNSMPVSYYAQRHSTPSKRTSALLLANRSLVSARSLSDIASEMRSVDTERVLTGDRAWEKMLTDRYSSAKSGASSTAGSMESLKKMLFQLQRMNVHEDTEDTNALLYSVQSDSELEGDSEHGKQSLTRAKAHLSRLKTLLNLR